MDENIVKTRKKYEILAAIQLLIFALLLIWSINLFPILTCNSSGAVVSDDVGIMPFNGQFLKFEGTIDGSRAKQLINIVNNNNRKYDDESMWVTITGGAITEETKAGDSQGAIYKTSDAKSGYKYNVSFSYEQESERINQINIEKIN